MVKIAQLSDELISGIGKGHYPLKPKVEKSTLEGIDEIQYLNISPWACIKMHGHDNQWEIWVRLLCKKAYVCLKGEEHELVNNCGANETILAIKGHGDYPYEDISSFLRNLGFSVTHGSMVICY